LEDSPLFNAGKGSVYTANETQEMDASIMDGKNRLTGAVASVSTVKNPIKLARKVAEETEHVLLVGDGAENFALESGLEVVDSDYFFHEERLKKVQDSKLETTKLDQDSDKIGTVGAVAIDKKGNIAAATSTGGMTNKMPGRVGDSPIIGSGTWAQNGVCGVSSTGHGEYFIKYQVAREVCVRIEYLNQSLSDSSTAIIDELDKLGASGGLIAIDHQANISTPFNTKGMIRGSQTNRSDLKSQIY
jgi:beta-aspartyl-peptidase (threonine type)